MSIAVVLFLISHHVQAEEKKLSVVVSFSILADVVKQIGGDAVDVTPLVAPGSDAHVFEPTPADAKRIASADLVIINGLGFEGWMTRLIESSGYKGKLVEASHGIQAISLEEEGEHESHEHDYHDHGALDPHVWQDVSNMLAYVQVIEAALSAARPLQAKQFQSSANAYRTKIQALDDDIKQAWAAVPKEKRKVITSHDAFGYYAKAYGVEFLAPLGMNTDSEATAQDIARLIDQIRAQNIKALFVESIASKRLIQQLEADSGAKMGGTLYSDSLCAAPCLASTYLDMMRHNTQLLVDAVQ
jgi:zinc/manganese transport system substrate-binding protein